MRRRDFLKVVTGAVIFPIAARAQQQMPTVGYLSAGNAKADAKLLASWVDGLASVGLRDGHTVRIEHRWADDDYDRLPALAADLVHREVAVIAAAGTPAARAAKAATNSIPVVFTTIADPVQIGFVRTLSRPGGNVTGATLLSVEVGPKLLELLHGIVPSVNTIGLLINPANPNAETQSKSTQEAARKLGLAVHVVAARTVRDFNTAFENLSESHAGALIIAQDILFNGQTEHLAALAINHSIPAIYPQPEFALNGGLISYGAKRSEAWRQSGVYVGRILNGEKPAELPVVQPTVFELAINLKTAKALGVMMPQSLVMSADKVID